MDSENKVDQVEETGEHSAAEVLQVPAVSKTEGSPGGTDSTGSVPSGSTASPPSVIAAKEKDKKPESNKIPKDLSSDTIPELPSDVSDDEYRDSFPVGGFPIALGFPKPVPKSVRSAPIFVPNPIRIITGFDGPTVHSPKGFSEDEKNERFFNRLGSYDKDSHLQDESHVSSSPSKVGSLLSRRLQMATNPAEKLPPSSSSVSVEPKENITSPVRKGSPAQQGFEPGSLRSNVSNIAEGSISTINQSQGSLATSQTSFRKNLRMRLQLKMGMTPRDRTVSESVSANVSSPISARTVFGSITIWNSRHVLERHISQCSSVVNYISEAASILPSLASTMSIDNLDQEIPVKVPVELENLNDKSKHMSKSNQEQMNILDILEQNEYLDTVKSTDSAAALLRRSVSVPPQYQYKSQHLQDVFNEAERNRKEPLKIVKKACPAYLEGESWKQTLDDLLEQPEYMNTTESSSSRTGLLANQARLMAQEYGTKPTLESIPSVSEQSTLPLDQLKFIYFKNLIVLSVGFMLVFLAYLSLRNLQSSLYRSGGLGILALSSVYASLFVGCIFATTVVHTLRPKCTLMVGFSGMFLYVLANFYPTYYTLIPACILTGFCLANIWTAHATYLACVAARYASVVDEKVQNVLSQFNGIFFAFFQSSQIVGGLISSLVLSPSKTSQEKYATSNSTLAPISPITELDTNFTHFTPECGAKFCSYLADNAPGSDSAVDKKMIYILIGIYGGCMLAGMLIICICLDPLDGVLKKAHSSLSSRLTAVFRFFGQWKVFCLSFLMFYTMLESSYLFGEYTKAFVSCTSGVYLVGYTMVCFSIMSAIASYVSGKVQRYIGRRCIFIAGLLIQMALIVLQMIWEPNEDHLILIFVIAAFWGMADGMILTQTISLFGVLFADNKEPAFAGMKMCQALGATILFASSESMCTMMNLSILLIVAALSLIGLQVLEYKLKQEAAGRREPEEEPV